MNKVISLLKIKFKINKITTIIKLITTPTTTTIIIIIFLIMLINLLQNLRLDKDVFLLTNINKILKFKRINFKNTLNKMMIKINFFFDSFLSSSFFSSSFHSGFYLFLFLFIHFDIKCTILSFLY